MRYVILLVPLIALLALGCEDGGEQAPPTPTATALATTAPTAPAGRTGIPELDAVIEFLLLDDTKAMQQTVRQLVGFTEIPCSATFRGMGGPPACQLNEEEGELVEVFDFGTCEGEYLRPHQIDRVLSVLAGKTLYAVYRAPPDYVFSGEYVAVVFQSFEDSGDLAWEVEISDGRIVGLHFSCAAPPEELVELRQLEEALLPPPAP